MPTRLLKTVGKIYLNILINMWFWSPLLSLLVSVSKTFSVILCWWWDGRRGVVSQADTAPFPDGTKNNFFKLGVIKTQQDCDKFQKYHRVFGEHGTGSSVVNSFSVSTWRPPKILSTWSQKEIHFKTHAFVSDFSFIFRGHICLSVVVFPAVLQAAVLWT